MASLPKRALIGHREIDMLLVPDDQLGDSRGDFNSFRGRIRVSLALLDADQAETMLHELLHACWRTSSIPSNYEEPAVEMLASNLAQVWADNEELIRWISRKLKRSPPST